MNVYPVDSYVAGESNVTAIAEKMVFEEALNAWRRVEVWAEEFRRSTILATNIYTHTYQSHLKRRFRRSQKMIRGCGNLKYCRFCVIPPEYPKNHIYTAFM